MVLVLISALAAFAGFGALCATTRRQMRVIWKTPLSPAKLRLLRLAGWLMLALSLFPCVAWWTAGGARWTLGMGIVAWACLLPIAALVLTFLFVLAKRTVIFAAAAAGAIACTLSIAWFAGVVA